MTEFRTDGTGVILPPGAAAPTATLAAGTHAVTIDGFDESGMVRCVYPDGFVKHHQAESVAELAEKVARQVRSRYGLTDVPFASAPQGITAGETFTVEVA